MAAKNDITGDIIKTKANSKKFEDNWDRIFGKKTPVKNKKTKQKTKANKAESV
jgi:hypothetical protein